MAGCMPGDAVQLPASARLVTAVMYHYVHDLKRSRYPRLKALDTGAFREQLAYIRRHYNVVGVRDVLAAFDGAELPPRPCVLTFDDGYRDHFTDVFPLLDELGWEGSFFPPVDAIVKNRVLDVNKIHFVLAAVEDIKPVSAFVITRLEAEQTRYGLPPIQSLVEHYSMFQLCYDTPEVNFVKRLLQRGLPEPLRSNLIDDLFTRFVTTDETAFAQELYVDVAQLRSMIRHGMVVGSHGRSHAWLDSLDPAAQAEEITSSLDFLEQLGVRRDDWVMCYPYGGYNDVTLDLVRRHGCRLGFSCQADLADLDRVDRLVFPRLDTNDLPSGRDTAEAPWTLKAGPRTQTSPRPAGALR